jgi:hypothetical protein
MSLIPFSTFSELGEGGLEVFMISAPMYWSSGTARWPVYRDLRQASPYSASRILDTTQIRRLIAFSSAADVTIQHFNAPAALDRVTMRALQSTRGVPHALLRNWFSGR